jgi:hypothetical protein
MRKKLEKSTIKKIIGFASFMVIVIVYFEILS